VDDFDIVEGFSCPLEFISGAGRFKVEAEVEAVGAFFGSALSFDQGIDVECGG
jgi:hypothetical protein